MRTFIFLIALSAQAAFASTNCMASCDKIPEVCTKACQSKGTANSGMCKSKCDEATKKCKDQCAKRGN